MNRQPTPRVMILAASIAGLMACDKGQKVEEAQQDLSQQRQEATQEQAELRRDQAEERADLNKKAQRELADGIRATLERIKATIEAGSPVSPR